MDQRRVFGRVPLRTFRSSQNFQPVFEGGTGSKACDTINTAMHQQIPNSGKTRGTRAPIAHAGQAWCLSVLVLLASSAALRAAPVYSWSKFVGHPGVSGSVDGTGAAALFTFPQYTAVDSAGSVYVTDSENHTIRKITADGVVTTLAGSAGVSGSADGTGSAARFDNPSGVAADTAGNLYVADRFNHTIRKVTAAGVVTTLAGSAGVSGSADGLGDMARFNDPWGVAVDSAGNIFVADSENNAIRKVTAAGVVTTLAGFAGFSGSADGTGIYALFYWPRAVAVDSAGNVFVADYNNHTIRKVTSAGVVTTLAGSAGNSGSSDGTGSSARFHYPLGVAVDSGGNVLVSDFYNRTIRKVTAMGVVTTLAGSAGSYGSADGNGSSARFYGACGLTVDTSGNAFVADTWNNTIRKVTSAGTVTTLAGSTACFKTPRGVAVDSAGNTYVADTYNHTIRKVTPTGEVSTLAGIAGSNGSTNGSPLSALFRVPSGVAVDSAGTVYVADTYNHTIRKVTSAGVVTTLAGSAGTFGSANGTGSAARFKYPSGVAVDGAGNVYVADADNHTIRKVTSAGVVTTLAGSAGNPGTANGTGSAARFYNPSGVAVDTNGNVFVADRSNRTIRKVTSAGVVTTLATGFSYPSGVAVDIAGNVFVADDGNSTIRKVTAAGIVTTIGGNANFSGPSGIAVDSAGILYVADSGNNRISKGTRQTGSLQVTLTPAAAVRAGTQWQVDGGVWKNSGDVVTGLDIGNHAICFKTSNGWISPPDQSVTINNGQTATATVWIASTPTYAWANLVGQPGGSGSVNGTGGAARFYNPEGVAIDGAGNIYVADYGNHTVRKVTAAGVVTTLAGSAGVAGSADGTGSAARFCNPVGVAVDGAGNVYVADTWNHTIRKVTPLGVVTTLAGSAGTAGSTDGTGNAAQFNCPCGVAVDSVGNVYVAERDNYTIRKVTPAGVVTTLAGSAGMWGSADGAGSVARFNMPVGVAVDSAGNVFVADTGNQTIRKVTPSGVVTTLAGSAGGSGSTDGTGITARFYSPKGVAADSAGNVYVADTGNQTIRKVTSAGVVTTLAGSAGVAGSADGTGSAARFCNPYGVAVDSTGNVFVGDTGNCTIRKVTAGGVVTTLAGSVGSTGSADGTGSAARFYSPEGVAVDSSGNMYVADTDNHTIRKVTASGVVTTLAGSSRVIGIADGTGSVARFFGPQGVAVDGTDNLFVADRNNHTIRKITAAGVVTTLAGSAGSSGSTNGTGGAARFYYPGGVAVDSTGNVFVADTYNHTIRKVTSTGVVTTLAGSAGLSGSTNDTGSAARFSYPSGVAVDNTGNVFVADTWNHTIRKVTPEGIVTTLAGRAGTTGSADGTGGAARFKEPAGVAVDSAGNVFVADTGNQTIRKVTAEGVVTTIGSVAGVVGGADGLGSFANFSGPSGLALDSAGNLYVADSGNNRITKGTPDMTIPTITTPPIASSITYGQTLGDSTLTGGAASVPGTFAFTTPATVPNAGVTSQSVIFMPTDMTNYTIVFFAVSVPVSKAVPTITTPPTASPITCGQTLADSTLTVGVASVPGVFAFTFPDTIPNVGTTDQAVTFTPTDTANFIPIVFSVAVTVNNPVGSLQVMISPAAAVTAGAQWQVDGGAWQAGGETLAGLAPGNHTVTFKAADGWNTPASVAITINPNETTSITGTYCEFSYTDDGTAITITDYPDSATGAVVIPATINGKPVTRIGVYAFSGCTEVTSVTIPGTITSIGDHAFAYCGGLTDITIPDSVTAIGVSAFYECIGLTSMTIPGNITSIGNSAFYGCGSLIRAEFLGNAPASMGPAVFDATASGFTVYYHGLNANFTSPTWNGYASVNLDPLPFAAWQGSRFTADDIATGLTTMTADFDRDGMANLLEYAFGGDPKSADAAGISPALNVDGSNRLQISFKCDTACADIIYTVQESSDLATWTDIATSTGGATTVPERALSTVSDTETGLRTVIVTAQSPGNRRFLRVKVTGGYTGGAGPGSSGGGGSPPSVNPTPTPTPPPI